MGDRDYMRPDYGPPGRPPFAPGGSFWRSHPATKAVLVGLVAIHLLMLVLRSMKIYSVYNLLSLNPRDVIDHFYLWQIVTSAFLHDLDGFWHLFFNGFVIYIFGRYAEEWLGKRRYLLFLLGSAVTASLGYLLFAALGSSVNPVVGASGAATALIAYVALRVPHMTVMLFFVFRVQLWVLAVILILMDVIGLLSTSGNVAHAAHLGGALYGYLYFKFSSRVAGVFDAIDRFADKREAERDLKLRRKEADLRREIDRILDKVNREGMAALSEEERRFLKEASGKLRR